MNEYMTECVNEWTENTAWDFTHPWKNTEHEIGKSHHETTLMKDKKNEERGWAKVTNQSVSLKWRNNQKYGTKKRDAIINHWLIPSVYCYTTELWIKSCLPKQSWWVYALFVFCLDENTTTAPSASMFNCPNQLPAVIRERWGKGSGEKSACIFCLPLWLAHLNDNVLQSGM